MKRLIFSMVVALVFSQSAIAGDVAEVRGIVSDKITKAIDLVKDKSMDKKIRNDKVVKAIKPVIDFNRMAMLSLGKKHYKRMTKKQRKEFVRLFSQQLQDSLVEKLDLYTDEEVVVENAAQKKKRVFVVTNLVAKDAKYEMIFKFYKSKKKKKWLVYDVEVQGVSLVQTYRSQFAGILKKDSIEALLKRLRVSGEFTIPTDGIK